MTNNLPCQISVVKGLAVLHTSKNYKKLDLEELKTEQNIQAARTKFALRTRMNKTVNRN